MIIRKQTWELALTPGLDRSGERQPDSPEPDNYYLLGGLWA